MNKKKFEYTHRSNLIGYYSAALALMFGVFLVTFKEHGYYNITVLAGILSIFVAIVWAGLLFFQSKLFKEIIGKNEKTDIEFSQLTSLLEYFERNNANIDDKKFLIQLELDRLKESVLLTMTVFSHW